MSTGTSHPGRDRRVIVVWMVTSVALFLVMVTLGILMRLAQGDVMESVVIAD